MTRATVALFAVASVACAACSSDATARSHPSDGGSADAGDERKIPPPPHDATIPPPPEPTYAPTFVALYNEVLVPVCGSPFCHGADGYYTLSSVDKAYASLVGVPATSKDCLSLGLLRVAPGKPEASLLYLKVTPSPPCGGRMPLQFGGNAYLTPQQIEQMKKWIELGAPFDHVPDSGVEAGHEGTADAATTDGSIPSDSSAGHDAAQPAPRDASVESG